MPSHTFRPHILLSATVFFLTLPWNTATAALVLDNTTDGTAGLSGFSIGASAFTLGFGFSTPSSGSLDISSVTFAANAAGQSTTVRLFELGLSGQAVSTVATTNVTLTNGTLDYINVGLPVSLDSATNYAFAVDMPSNSAIGLVGADPAGSWGWLSYGFQTTTATTTLPFSFDVWTTNQWAFSLDATPASVSTPATLPLLLLGGLMGLILPRYRLRCHLRQQ